MFGNLFGKKKKKIDPEKQKELDKKKNQLESENAVKQLDATIDKNQKRMDLLQERYEKKKREAALLKKKGHKERCLAAVREYKTMEKQMQQASTQNILLLKQKATLESVSIDNNMADQLKKTNAVLERAQKQQEENVDVIQDTIAINQEIDYNQQQMNDIIMQQTEELNEGLEEEFAALDELDMLDALEDYDTDNVKKDTTTQKNTKKQETNFDSMMNDLIN